MLHTPAFPILERGSPWGLTCDFKVHLRVRGRGQNPEAPAQSRSPEVVQILRNGSVQGTGGGQWGVVCSQEEGWGKVWGMGGTGGGWLSPHLSGAFSDRLHPTSAVQAQGAQGVLSPEAGECRGRGEAQEGRLGDQETRPKPLTSLQGGLQGAFCTDAPAQVASSFFPVWSRCSGMTSSGDDVPMVVGQSQAVPRVLLGAGLRGLAS